MHLMSVDLFVALLQKRLFEFDSLHYGNLHAIQPETHIAVVLQSARPRHLVLGAIRPHLAPSIQRYQQRCGGWGPREASAHLFTADRLHSALLQSNSNF